MKIPSVLYTALTDQIRPAIDKSVRYRTRDGRLIATAFTEGVWVEASGGAGFPAFDVTIAKNHAVGLLELAKNQGGDLEMELADHALRVRSGQAAFSFPFADELPEAPHVAADEPSPKGFASALKQVIPAVSSDPARGVLCGVLLDEENVVATDGIRLHRAHAARNTHPPETSITVPLLWAKTVAKINKDGCLGSDREGRIMFVFDGKEGEVSVVVVGQALEGTYPDWSQFSHEGVPSVVVNRQTLLRTITTSAALGDNAEVEVVLVEGQIGVKTAAGAMLVPGRDASGSSEKPIKLDGRFVVAALESTTVDEVRFGGLEGFGPASIAALDGSFLAIVCARR